MKWRGQQIQEGLKRNRWEVRYVPTAPQGSLGEKLLLIPAHPLPRDTLVQEPRLRVQNYLVHFSWRCSTVG